MDVDFTTDVLILGGGLSGLHTAAGLQEQGRSYVVAEARPRLGGRILSQYVEDDGAGGAGFDLGPAWFWPGQRRMEGLVRSLGLASQVVEQFGHGDALFEDPSGAVRRGHFGIAMLGSYRLRGGMEQLIRGLEREVPGTSVRLGWRAVRLVASDDEGEGSGAVTTHFETSDGHKTVRSRHVVMALPPRLAAGLDLEPALSPELKRRLRSTPTWMAGQGKLVVVYDEPFWRHGGLSGDAVSHRGPLGEIHDISPPAQADGRVRPGALFGFFAWPPELRRRSGASLQEACLVQLGKLFGKRAGEPQKVWFKDWATSDHTSTDTDRRVMAPHDERGLVLPQDDPWSRRILWSGSESASVAQRFNGYLEGALEASERVLGRLAEGQEGPILRLEKRNFVL